MLNVISSLQKPIPKGRLKYILDARQFEHPPIKAPRMLTEFDMFTKQELQNRRFEKEFIQRLSCSPKGGTELP